MICSITELNSCDDSAEHDPHSDNTIFMHALNYTRFVHIVS